MDGVETYERKIVKCQAIQITAENIHDVAKWCGGVVREAGTIVSEPSIDMTVSKHGAVWRGLVYVGEWVTSNGEGYFTGYSDAMFRSEFEVKEEVEEAACKWPNCLDQEQAAQVSRVIAAKQSGKPKSGLAPICGSECRLPEELLR